MWKDGPTRGEDLAPSDLERPAVGVLPLLWGLRSFLTKCPLQFPRYDKRTEENSALQWISCNKYLPSPGIVGGSKFWRIIEMKNKPKPWPRKTRVWQNSGSWIFIWGGRHLNRPDGHLHWSGGHQGCRKVVESLLMLEKSSETLED